MAKEVDNDKEARVAIEKFCESFEKEILEEFDKAYEEGDPRVMAVSLLICMTSTQQDEMLTRKLLALCKGLV